FHRRRACRVGSHRQQGALAQQAAAHGHFRAEFHTTELRTVDVGDAVVLGQPLVDVGVVGGQQVEDAAILVNDAAEEQFDLAPVGVTQGAVEVREQFHHRL